MATQNRHDRLGWFLRLTGDACRALLPKILAFFAAVLAAENLWHGKGILHKPCQKGAEYKLLFILCFFIDRSLAVRHSSAFGLKCALFWCLRGGAVAVFDLSCSSQSGEGLRRDGSLAGASSALVLGGGPRRSGFVDARPETRRETTR
jgi:hypothetical protein